MRSRSERKGWMDQLALSRLGGQHSSPLTLLGDFEAIAVLNDIPISTMSGLLRNISCFRVLDSFGSSKRSEASFKRTNPSLKRVRGDEVEENIVRDREETRGKGVGFELLGEKVLLGDDKFLVVLPSKRSSVKC